MNDRSEMPAHLHEAAAAVFALGERRAGLRDDLRRRLGDELRVVETLLRRGDRLLRLHDLAVKTPARVIKIDHAAEELSIVKEDLQPGAEILVISYGITSRSAAVAIRLARAEGRKVSSLVLQTIWPA